MIGSVLIACEESQIVTNEFRALGIEAWSCDIEPTSGDHPEWHIQQDVIPLLKGKWDMIIAFPPCTHLSASGARYFNEKRSDGRQQKAIDFFLEFVRADCPKIAIENPVGIMSRIYRKPDQIIQPWQFGHGESKRTCLWLKGLPKLVPTQMAEYHLYRCKCGNVYSKEIGRYCTNCGNVAQILWYNQTKSGQNKLGPSQDRAKIRSKTYLGIAKAMANQWSEVK